MTMRVILASGHEIKVDDEIAEEILAVAKRPASGGERHTIEFGGTDQEGNEFDGSVFSDHVVGIFR
jgi:hypothetical protein